MFGVSPRSETFLGGFRRFWPPESKKGGGEPAVWGDIDALTFLGVSALQFCKPENSSLPHRMAGYAPGSLGIGWFPEGVLGW